MVVFYEECVKSVLKVVLKSDVFVLYFVKAGNMYIYPVSVFL